MFYIQIFEFGQCDWIGSSRLPVDVHMEETKLRAFWVLSWRHYLPSIPARREAIMSLGQRFCRDSQRPAFFTSTIFSINGVLFFFVF
ncbi:hypothetical protein LguiB_016853 [Lonicera macranthoides]